MTEHVFSKRVRAVWKASPTDESVEMRPRMIESENWIGVAFAYSYGSNTLEDQKPARTEEELIQHIREGARVRMDATDDSGRSGLYNLMQPRNLVESWIDDDRIYPK